MPKLIGITGTIGSGKSTVGSILSSLNIPVVDTDHIVHELLSNNELIKQDIVERFGYDITNNNLPDGDIDRKRLGKIVFSDKKARHDLEVILHPAVLIECTNKFSLYKNESLVAVLVPLLFEVGWQSRFDEIWTVVTDEKVLHQRLANRDPISDEEIKNRINAQLPQKEKASRADRVIDNSGTVEQTKRQIELLIEQVSLKQNK